MAGPADHRALGHSRSGRGTGSEAEIALAFKDAYRMLNRRIELFLALPIEKLDRLVLTTRLKAIGRSEGATEKAQHVDV